jgi:magnesium chelatase subunit I
LDIKKITTLGALKKSKYKSQSIKEEMRNNLVQILQDGEKSLKGIIGFDDTVVPDIERAILSRHNILLLGLRGQAKTRIARQLVNLLDEYMPIISGSEINDDPLNPISAFGKTILKENGDDTKIEWVHRADRYVEKLATPDVSIGDLIGDVDPIKAATLKLPYSDERVIHFGLIPRAHRCLFVINELPDLQARIQVALFNILQEEDLQIRGFKLRFPLDIQFLFTANPEDYTNRGSIVTPLKDRIESQILTHYPRNIEDAKHITQQEAKVHGDQEKKINVPSLIADVLETMVFKARESEYVDVNSGVSARLSISAMENLASTAERRMLKNGEKNTTVRLSDFWGAIPSITGKIELVYEGEQEGPYAVALHLLEKSIKQCFNTYFSDPNDKKHREKDEYGVIKAWFQGGNEINLYNDDSDKKHKKALDSISGMDKILDDRNIAKEDKYAMKELLLHGLAAYEILGKDFLNNTLYFNDPLAGMLSDLNLDG